MATNLPALPQPTDVDRTPGERILTGVGGVLSAGGGRSNDQSPLIQAVNKVHQRRVDEAQMYRRVYSSYAAQMAMGVDDTGKHFIDPTNGQVLDQDAYDAVSNKMNAAHDAYSKAAGVDKTTKSALDTHRTIVDHLIGLFQKNRESGNGQATAYTPDAAAAATAPAPTSAAPTAGAAGGTGGGATGSPPNVPTAAAAGPSSLPAPPAPPTAPSSPTDLAKPMAGGRVPPPPASGPVTTGTDGVPLTGTSKQPITNAGGSVMTPPPLSPSPKAGAARASAQAAQQQPMDAMTLSVGAERAQQAVDFQRWKDTQKYMTDLKTAEGVAVAKARAQSKPEPRPVGSMTMSVLDARKITAAGQPLIGYDGEPIDVDTLDPSMGLKAMLVRDPDTQKWEPRYVPFSPNQKTVTVGNETYAVNPADVSKLTQGAGTDLGVHNVPSTSSHTAPGITLSGDIGNVTTSTTRTPQVRGIPGRGTAAPAPGMPSAPPTAGAPRATGAAGVASGPAAGGKNQQNIPIPFAAANQLRQAFTPVREAASQIFGDPSQPDLKSLKDFAHLADDPGSQKRLGQALTLTLNEYEAQAEKAGGFMTLFAAAGGVPQALAAVQAKVLRESVSNLTPEEKEAYNGEVAALSMMIGMRSLSKGSAAKFSATALEREVPLIGINTTNSSQFHDKMAHIAEEVYNGSRTLPFPAQDKAYYKSQVTEMAKRRDNAPGAPAAPKPPAGTPSGKKLSPQATEYLRSQGIPVP